MTSIYINAHHDGDVHFSLKDNSSAMKLGGHLELSEY